jgi:hypothetical protein
MRVMAVRFALFRFEPKFAGEDRHAHKDCLVTWRMEDMFNDDYCLEAGQVRRWRNEAIIFEFDPARIRNRSP